MQLLGFLLNFKDGRRVATPTGFFVTHERTRMVVAVSTSPLSDLLVNLFLNGGSFFETTVFLTLEKREVKPKDVASYRELAPKYFASMGWVFKEVMVPTPLSTSLGVTEDLSLSRSTPAFETLTIGAYAK